MQIVIIKYRGPFFGYCMTGILSHVTVLHVTVCSTYDFIVTFCSAIRMPDQRRLNIPPVYRLARLTIYIMLDVPS
jgi:hypothetical protein